MNVPVKALFLAALVVLAGCGNPQTPEGDDNESGPAEDTPVTDNEAGGEPNAPPNDTNTSDSNETEPVADENESAGQEDGNDTGAGGESVNDGAETGALV